jgi:hypothetical protein
MVPHPLIHRELVDAQRNQLLESAMKRHRLRACLAGKRPPRVRTACETNLRRSRTSLATRFLSRRRNVTSVTPIHFAHREADGITVDLFWSHSECQDAFRVDIVDRRRDIEFILRPATGKEALEAYHHPFFALALAARGLDAAA